MGSVGVVRADTVVSVPVGGWGLAEALVAVGVPLSWQWAWGTLRSVGSSWADTVSSVPNEWSLTVTSVVQPLSWEWAWFAVVSVESWGTNAVLSVPNSVLGANTLAGGGIPESW